jgi:hypothetical protein
MSIDENKEISLIEWSDALYKNLFEDNFGLILLGKTRLELDEIGRENNLGDHTSFYNCLFRTTLNRGRNIEVDEENHGEICEFVIRLLKNWRHNNHVSNLREFYPEVYKLSLKEYPPYLSILVFLASVEFEPANNQHAYYPKIERIITEFGFPNKLFSQGSYRDLCNRNKIWEKFDDWCQENGSRIQKYSGTYQRYVQRARVHSLIDFGNRKNIYNLLKDDFSFTVPPSIRQIKDRIIRYPDVNKKLCIENCNDNDKLISQSVYSLILNDLRIGFVRKSNEIINLKPVYFLNQKYGEFKLVRRLDVSKGDINNFPLLFNRSDIKLDKNYNNLISSKLDNIPDFNIDINFIINKNYRITRSAKDYLIFKEGKRNREYIETNKILQDQDYYVLCSNKSFNNFSTWKDNLPDNEKDYVIRQKYRNEGELFLIKSKVITTFTSDLVKDEISFETIDDIKVIGGIKIENNIYANIHPPYFEIEGVVKKENIHLYLNNNPHNFEYDYKIIDNLTYIIFNGELPFGVIKIYCLLEGKKKDDLIEKEECFIVQDETHILFEKNSPNWLSQYSVESDCITDNQDDDIEIEGELCLDVTTVHLIDLQKKFTDEHCKYLLENIKKWNLECQ